MRRLVLKAQQARRAAGDEFAAATEMNRAEPCCDRDVKKAGGDGIKPAFRAVRAEAPLQVVRL